jgi:glycosyl transferase family 87
MRGLWILLAAALAGRLVLAFATGGNPYDLESFALTNGALSDGDPWDAYGQLLDPVRWPYPPGFFPWVLAAPRIAFHTGLPFDGVIQIPAALCDVAIAGLVAWILTHRGAPRREVLAGAALIALSPLFVADSSYHGQIDSVATLPALAGVWLWARAERRVLAAALLLGLAAAIKTPLALVVVALLPTARSVREAGTLALASAAVPLVLLAPFLAADARGVVDALTYKGLVGLGGLAVIVQPSLPSGWLEPGFHLRPSRIDAATTWLEAAVVAFVLAVGMRVRQRPLDLVCLMFLAVWSFTLPWSYTYLVWGIPFLVVARRWWIAGALTALGLPLVLILYTGPHSGALVGLYTATVIAIWVVTVAGTVVVARDLVRAPLGVVRS